MTGTSRPGWAWGATLAVMHMAVEVAAVVLEAGAAAAGAVAAAVAAAVGAVEWEEVEVASAVAQVPWPATWVPYPCWSRYMRGRVAAPVAPSPTSV